MIAAVFAVALLAAGADPAAQAAPTGAAPSATPTKSEKANKDGLVCRKEAVIGSRMKSRTCLPQSEWDRMKNEARDQVEKSQSVKPLTF
jgi:hypothetical protein